MTEHKMIIFHGTLAHQPYAMSQGKAGIDQLNWSIINLVDLLSFFKSE